MKLRQLNEQELSKKVQDKIVLPMNFDEASDIIDGDDLKEKREKLKPITDLANDLIDATAKGEKLIDPDLVDIKERKIVNVNESLEAPTENQQIVGLETLINEAIKSEFDAINEYGTIMVTLEDSGYNEEIIKIIKDIRDEEMIHVGELQHILSMARPENGELVDKGNSEADENTSDSQVELVNEAWSEEERKAAIDRNWVKINSLELYRPAGNIADEFEINIITRQVRNAKTGHMIPYVDQIGTTAQGETTVAVRKQDGRNTNLQRTRLIRALDRQYPRFL